MSGNYVRKTSVEVDGLGVLLEAMISGGDGSRTIEASEAAGQRQLVASSVIPSEISDRDGFEAVGFVFGDVVKGDELFIECTLPDGWSKQGSDHAMWSYIVDQLGRRRVACFYKAAFYDRRAFCRLETVASYLRSVVYNSTAAVLDETWCTRALALDTLDEIAGEYEERAAEYRHRAEGSAGERWTGYASEEAAEALKFRSLMQTL